MSFTALRKLLLFGLLLPISVLGQAGPASLNLSGGLFNPNGTAILDTTVNFKVEVYDANATCLLYSEEHLGQNLSQTKGGFSLQLGSGTSQTNYLESSTTFDRVLFVNSGAVAAFSGCPSGLTFNAGDNRVIRVSYDVGQGFVTMTPDVPITNTPYAMVADTLQGLPASGFVQTDSVSLTQANVGNIFSNINYPKLEALLSGTSSQYIPSQPGASVSFNGQQLTNIANPTAAQDAATKNYADNDLGGLPITIAGIGAGMGGGKTLVWDQVADAWVAQTAGTVTYVGSGTGLLGGNFSTQGTLSVDVGTTANKILQLNAQAQIPALDGSLLFNVNATRLASQSVSTVTPSFGQILGWNASSSKWEPQSNAGITALSGDVVATGPGSAAATIQANAVNLASKINNGGNGPNQLLITDPTTGQTVGYGTCTLVGQVYQWTAQGWQCVNVSTFLGNSSVGVGTYGTATMVPQITVDANGRVTTLTNVNIAFPVTSVAGRTGDVVLNAADISGLGTAATKDYGTAAGNLVQLDGGGMIPLSELPTGTGTITGVIAGTALVGGGTSGVVTLSVDVGITANKVVRLNAQAQYPGNDGSLITNVNAAKLQTVSVSTTIPNSGQVLAYNQTNQDWEPTSETSGTVTSVGSGTGLLGGTITSAGTLSVDVGTAAGKILQVTALGLYPADDGSLISNLNATRIGTRIISTAGPNPGQVLAWNTTNADWEPTSVTSGTVTSVSGGVGLTGGPITSSGTLNIDVGTAANKILQVTSSGIYPADDGSLLSNVNATRIGTRTVSTNTPNPGQVLSWNTTNGDWEPSSASALSVVSVAGGTGLVANTITSTGTLTVDVGTAANKILQVTSSGIYPADDGSLLSNLNATRIGTRTVSTNTPNPGQVLSWNTTNGDWEPSSASALSVVSVAGGTGLVANTITSSGTLTVDVGTAANKILQVTAAGIYPADDGSLLSNLNATRIGTRTVSTNTPNPGQVLSWNTTNGDWEPSSASALSVVSVAGGTGLVANTITSSGTLTVDVGTAANKILQVTASGIYPADDGSLLSNLNATRIGTRTVSTNTPNPGQVLSWNTTNGDWEPSSASALSVVSVAGGTGLVANTITSNGTLTVDVGTAANKILQVTAAGVYPADDGSLLSNLNATRIGTRTVSTNLPNPNQVLGWNSSNSDWEPISASTGSVTSVVSGTGLVANTISQTGTLSIDVGTAANKILQVTASGLYPADDGSLISNLNATRIGTRTVSTNTPNPGQVLSWNTTNGDWEPSNASALSVVSVAGGTGLVANTITSSGTLTVDVGTAANKILQVTSSGIYPADDGSLLSNLNATRIGTRTVSTNLPNPNQVLGWNSSNSDWEPISASTGSVTSVVSGTGLVANTISQTGTLTVDVGTAANKILQVTASGLYPADDGSLLSNLNATRIGTRTVSTNTPNPGQVLSWNTTNGDWEPSNASALSVVSVAGGTGLVANTITSTGTLTVDVGTAANKILQVTAAGVYPADDGSLLSNLNATRIGTRTVSTNLPNPNQVLGWNSSNSDWEPISASTGSVTSVVSGTGLIANTISQTGTLSIDVGTAANKILQVTASGLYPADDGSLLSNLNATRIGTRTVSTNLPNSNQVLGWNSSNSDWEPISASTGSVTSVVSGTGLVANTISQTGTLSIDVGTAANKILQVTASGLYPADDGSLLSNLNATRIGTRTVSTNTPNPGQVLSWNTTNGDWEPSNASALSVVSVASGTGLVANTITSTGTLAIDVGTAANKILQVTSSGIYPADDGSLLSNLNATRIGTRTISTNLPNPNQVLGWNSSNSDWEPISASTGSVTSVVSGTGLVANTISQTGTLAIDVGTAANKILQVTATGLYPADDGSLLSNLNATRIGTRTVSTNLPNPNQVLGWNSSNSDWEPISASTGSVTSVVSGTGLVANTISQTGTLAIDVGTAANKILQVTSTGIYPADDGSLLSNLNATRIGTRTVSTNTPNPGQVLSWNTTNSDWEPSSASALSVVSVTGGTGLVANTITSSGTLTVDVGTAANKILQVTSSGQYPADDGSLLSNLNATRIGTRTVSTNLPNPNQVLGWNSSNSDWEPISASTGSVTSVVSGTGLVANTISQTGTLAIDVGTAANKILQVTASGIYPADDGSLLSNLNATRIGTRTVSTNLPNPNQVLGWNSSNSDWEPISASTGSVTSVVSGTGLVANTISQTGTLAIDVGTAANKILQVTASGLYPADDGSLLSNLNATRIGTRTVSTNLPNPNQVLGWNSSNSDWEPISASTGSVTSVVSGTGLVANTISQAGTLAIDVGTAANKILQVTASGLYPADDGSLLSNLNATRIGTRTVSTNLPNPNQVLGWNSSNSDWEPISASTGSVTSVVSGTGLIANTISQTGTLSIDVGTAANKILQVTASGLYPADDGSLLSNLNATRIGTRTVSTNLPNPNQVLGWNSSNSDWEPISASTGSVTSVVSGTGLIANTISQTGTLSIDVGTAANKILQVTASGLYPADDGSLLSNLNATRIGTRTVSTNLPNPNQVLGWNSSNSDWEPISASTGSVTSVVSGTGLVANTISQTGTLSIDVGTAANKILQVTSTGIHPAIDGSLMTNLNAARIGTRTVSTNLPNPNQVLGWNSSNSDWEPISASTGSVTSVVSGTGLVANTISQTGTLSIDVGTAANKILQVTAAGIYPADDGSLLSNLNATRIGTRTVSTNLPNPNQVLGWNSSNSDWEPISASTGSVTSVVSGTGLVANTISQIGTLAIDVGTAANKILQVTASGLYPADDGSLLSNLNANRIGTRTVSTNLPNPNQVLGWNSSNSDWEPISASTGSVTSVVSGTGLVANTISQTGTLSVDVGTAANKILQVTSTGIHPAIDGSLMTNLNATRIGTRTVSTNLPNPNQVLGWNSSNSDWEPISASTGSVTSVVSGAGLVANTISQTGTLSIDVGTAANKILQVTASGLYPADDGSLLSNLNATRIGSRTVSTNLPNPNQVLGWNSSNSDWEPISASTGSVTSVVSGTGLVANTISQTGTLSIDVGTAANKILQVTSSGLYPADDGSLLSNLNATRIGTHTVSTNFPNPNQVLGWNSSNSDWEPISASTGSVTSVVSGTGLVANTISQTGTLSIDVGTAANKILQVTATGLYPADDGSLLSNLNATRIGTRTVSTNLPNPNQVLGWNSSNSDWEPISASTGSVTSVVSGTGLVANTISQTGTLSIDVGTAANKILQVTASGLYPADDGSLLSNLNATRIGTRTVSTNLPNPNQVLGWNSSNSDWEPISASTGSVTSVVSGTGLVANTISQTGTLTIDVGTAANKILQVTATGLYPADDGSLLSNLNATRIGTRTVSTNLPNPNQVLGWNSSNSDWEPISASTGSVTSVVSGTGLVANTISQIGTLAIDVGTAANKILQVTSSGIYPADDGSLLSNLNATRIGTRTVSTNLPNPNQVLGWNSSNSDWEPISASTGSVTSVVSGTGLVANTISQTGTLSIDVGTAANKILQVTSTGIHPAIDGSLMTNLNATRIGTRTVSTNLPNPNQVLGWNSSNSDWEPISASTGSVTSVVSGTGLVANTISQTGTLAIDVGTAANKILQVTSSGIYPADDGSLLSNLNATRIGTRTVSTNLPNPNQVLGWNSSNSDWEPISASTGSVTSVVSGTGLVANTISQTGTLSIDVGTAANKILQVTSSGVYPADDGSLLSNLNATRIGTRTVSTNLPNPNQVLGWNSSNSDWEPISASTGSVTSVVSGTGLVANTISQTGTLSIDVGTAANKILQVTSTGIHPAIDGSLMTNLNATRIGTRTVSTNLPNPNQVLGWNSSNSDWEPISASTGSVTSVVSGTGLVANTISQTGTLSIDVGTAANKILQVTASGVYPADDGSLLSNLNATRIGTRTVSTNLPNPNQVLGWNSSNSDWEPISASTGSVTSVVSGTGLIANTISQTGTLSIDVGTAANKILQVTAAGIYPADDGSLLSNLNATRIGTRTISTNLPNPNQVLGWNSSNSDWEPISASTGSVTSVVSGTGLVANTISQIGTLAIDVGTAANKILQVTSAGVYPQDDGYLISNINATNLAGKPLSLISPTAGQVLTYNGTLLKWDAETTAGGSSSLSSLTAATAINTIANGANAQTWNWDSLTSQNALTLGSTSLTTGALMTLNNSNNSASSVGSSLSLLTTGSSNASTGITITHAGSSAGAVGQKIIMSTNGTADSATGLSITNGAGAGLGLTVSNSNTAATANGTAVQVNLAGGAGFGVDINASNSGATVNPVGLRIQNSGGSSTAIGAQISMVNGTGSGTGLKVINSGLGDAVYSTSTSGRAGYFSSSNGYGLIVASGSVGIGTVNPAAALDVYGLGTAQSAIIVPRDTAANRPSTPVNGMIRYASDTGKFEGYQSGVWTNLITALSGNSVALSNISAATATNTIDNANFAQTWNWSTATTQNPLSINSNSLTTGSALAIATSNAGFNSTNGLLNVANTSASTNGILARLQSNSTAGSGLTVLSNGSVGIGTSAPYGLLDASATMTQTAAGYYDSIHTQDDVAPTSASSANSFTGNFSRITTSSDNVGGATLEGTDTSVQLYGGSSTVNSIIGVIGSTANYANRVTSYSTAGLFNVTQSSSGSTTNAHAVEVNVTNSGGTLGTGVGIYIGGIQGSAHYSLFASDASSPSYFAGAVGIGTASPNSILDINGLGTFQSAVIVPRDTVANRPSSPVNGMIRYASDTGKFEGYQSGTWQNLISTAGGTTAMSSLTNATAANSINNLNYAQTWNWSSATTQNPLTISANNLTSGSGLVLSSSNNSLNSTNGLLEVVNSGTSTNGVIASFQEGSSFSTGATLFMNGDVAFNTSDPYTNSGSTKTNGASAFGFTGSNNTSTSYPILNLANSDATENPGDVLGQINFIDSHSLGSGKLRAQISSYNGPLSGLSGGGGYLLFSTRTPGGALTEAMRIDVNNLVGIGTQTPNAVLDVYATGTLASAIIVPRDTTTNRPGAPVNGMIRYATNTGKFEAYQSGTWQNMISTAGGTTAMSSLTNATVANTLDNLNFAQNWNWSTASTQNLLTVNSNALTTGSGLTLSTSNTGFKSTNGFLDIANTGTSTSGILARFQSNSTAGSGLTVLANGSVGIGVSSPTATLDVLAPTGNGSTYVTSGRFASNPNGTGPTLYNNFILNNTQGTNAQNIITFQKNGSDQFYVGNDYNGAGALNFFISDNSGSNRLLVNSVGSIGIGTNTPAAMLDIYGLGTGQSAMIVPRDSTANRPTSPVNGMIRYASDTGKFEAYQSGTWTNLITASSGNTAALSNITAAIATNTIDNTTYAQTWNWSSATTQNLLTSNANSLTTGSMLALKTNSTSLNSTSGLLDIENNSTATSGLIARIQANNTVGSGVTVMANGNVGIGTNNPTGYVHIQHGSSGATPAALNLVVESSISGGMSILSPDTATSAIDLGSPSAPTGGTVKWDYTNNKMTIGTSNLGAQLAFLTSVSGERMRIDQSGNVGIGSTTPAGKLDVEGSGGVIFNAGNVGIGTANPAAILDVYGLGTGQSAMIVPRDLTTKRPSTPVNGMIRYATDTGKFEGYQSGTWTNLTGAGGGTTAMSSLTNATAANVLDNTTYAQTWNWSSATTQNPLTINANSLTTGSGVTLSTSSASLNSTSGLLNVANTGASTNGILARFQSNSTAGSGMTILTNGNVGIGTATPSDRLQVEGSVHFNSSSTSGAGTFTGASITTVQTTIPVTSTTGFASSGTILIDNEFITYSSTDATDFIGCTRGVWGSTAQTHFASGVQSVSFASLSGGTANFVVLSDGSIQTLGSSTANANSIALGGANNATGANSVAIGYAAGATNFESMAFGSYVTASGQYSVAVGTGNTASGLASSALGSNTSAPAYEETTIGAYNSPSGTESATTWNSTDPILEVGNGTSNSALSNAMVILKNGNTGIGSSAPQTTLDVNGPITMRKGYYEAVGSLGTVSCGSTNITGFTTNLYSLTACSSGTSTINIPTITGWPSGSMSWNVTFYVTGATASVFNVNYNGATTNVYWDKNSTGSSGGSGYTGFALTSGHTAMITCAVINTGSVNLYCGVGAQY